ncbi:43659_t:CDS:2 [Gigaspora margarita]|uniref:43659_t:CDS:1 n=1 Tax=Gigaspora margarita TaxID=4874 RepID=A0ABN7UQH4_GIGMA|nr:43659_t:CDS:2 [Gigaspora margarita]
MSPTTPILAHPNDKKEYSLYKDASHLALEVILVQVDDDKKDHIIEYASHMAQLIMNLQGYNFEIKHRPEEETYNHLVKYFLTLTVLLDFDAAQIQKLKSQAQYFIVQKDILYKKNKEDHKTL